MRDAEWAILKNGHIVNVVATSQGRAAAERTAECMTGGPYTVVLLGSLPDATKRAYEFWDNRP